MASQPENARQSILTSAIAIFARKGYAGASVQDILQATRLSKPTLYYYFKSKEGLFRAILDFAYDESFRLVKETVGAAENCQQRLVAVANTFFQFSENNKDLMRLVLATVFAAPEEIPPNSLNAEKRKRNFDFVVEIIRQGQESRELDSEYDALEMTHTFFGAVSHRIRTYLLTLEGRLDTRRAERTVALFLEGARNRDTK